MIHQRCCFECGHFLWCSVCCKDPSWNVIVPSTIPSTMSELLRRWWFFDLRREVILLNLPFDISCPLFCDSYTVSLNFLELWCRKPFYVNKSLVRCNSLEQSLTKIIGLHHPIKHLARGCATGMLQTFSLWCRPGFVQDSTHLIDLPLSPQGWNVLPLG